MHWNNVGLGVLVTKLTYELPEDFALSSTLVDALMWNVHGLTDSILRGRR